MQHACSPQWPVAIQELMPTYGLIIAIVSGGGVRGCNRRTYMCVHHKGMCFCWSPDSPWNQHQDPPIHILHLHPEGKCKAGETHVHATLESVLSHAQCSASQVCG